jgi:hypothetical protein
MKLLDYLRLDTEEKKRILWKEGTIIDVYCDNGRAVTLYYVYNFFVEITASAADWEIVDLIPYKSGFRVPQSEKKKKEEKMAQRINYYFLL